MHRIIIITKILVKLIAAVQRTAFNIFNPASIFRDPTKIFLDWTTPLQLAARSQLEILISSPKSTSNIGVENLAVIIPFRDQWPMTAKCLQALAKQNDLQSTETKHQNQNLITLIDNESKNAETLTGLKNISSLIAHPWTVNVTDFRAPFHFAKMNNLAVEALPEPAEWLFFLNNDVELIDPQSLSKLLNFARMADRNGFPLGAVGCTLLYPNRRIQHLFAAPGVKIAAAHPCRGARWCEDLAWNRTPQPVAAVTGAAMLVKRETFMRVGGFDENLPTAAQDIDLCLKLQRASLINIAMPSVVGIHHESLSRRTSHIPRSEIAYFYEKWGDLLHENPWYSAKFSRWHEQPALRFGVTAHFPWEKILR